MDMTVEVIGERKIRAMLVGFPAALHSRLKARISAQIAELESRVRAQVPRRTGRLAAEISSTVYDNGPEWGIKGLVWVNAPGAADAIKAAALEYGSTFTQAHPATLNHLWGRFHAPIEVMVKAHARNLMPEAFLRGPMAALQGRIVTELQAEIDAAVDQVQR